MSFHKRTCDHLARYKETVMGLSAPGKFRYRKEILDKAHILPEGNDDLNLLGDYRDRFGDSQYSKITRHRYFHHLNSSQALCINLFYPLIAEGQLKLFPEFLGLPLEEEPVAIFEKTSDLENSLRRTSFDFHLHHKAIGTVFVEVKYTENGFSRAKNDAEHQNKFSQVYRPLVEKSTFLNDVCRDENTFLKHYQILRNLVHIDEVSRVVLLFPRANQKVAKEAAFAHEHLLTESGKSRMDIVFLEEFVGFLEQQCVNTALGGYYKRFGDKYLPVAQSSP